MFSGLGEKEVVGQSAKYRVRFYGPQWRAMVLRLPITWPVIKSTWSGEGERGLRSVRRRTHGSVLSPQFPSQASSRCLAAMRF